MVYLYDTRVVYISFRVASASVSLPEFQRAPNIKEEMLVAYFMGMETPGASGRMMMSHG